MNFILDKVNPVWPIEKMNFKGRNIDGILILLEVEFNIEWDFSLDFK